MALNQAILPELDQEMSGTRKMLERVPEARFGWKPHAKSMTLGGLANHLADIPNWGVVTMEMDELDIAPVDGPSYKPSDYKTARELVAAFDQQLGKMRALIAAASDEVFMRPWTLKAGGKAMFTMPKIAVMRSMIFNHGIHHRAQLGVYLRMNDVPVPSLYGPSADEGTI